MDKFLKKTGWTSIVTSIVFALIAILLICNPEGVFKFATTVLGIIFIAVGIFKVFSYFSNKGSYDFFNYELIFGLLAIVIGIVIIVYSSTIETIFRIIIGIWIIYSGIMRLLLSSKLKATNSNLWYAVLTLAILMIICGLYITFNAGAVIMTIGIIMLVYAIMDLIEGCIFVRNVNKMYKQ